MIKVIVIYYDGDIARHSYTHTNFENVIHEQVDMFEPDIHLSIAVMDLATQKARIIS